MLRMALLLMLLTGPLAADQLSESGFLHFLQESYARNDEAVNEQLTGECALFLRTFPNSPDVPVVLEMLAGIHYQEGRYIQAAVYYLELLRLYPGAEAGAAAQKSLRTILQEKEARAFATFVQQFDDYLAAPPRESSLSGRFYDHLAFLYALDHPDINPYLTGRMVFYLHAFDQDVRNPDQIVYWIAELHKKERDWIEAMMAFEKMIALKPESALVPDVIFNLGLLQYQEMGRHAEARDNFIRLITDYPEKEISGEAQFYLGELYQRKLDDPNEAMTNYRLLIEAYPDNPHAVEALKRTAEIHYDAERYEKAINIYEEIYDRYRTAAYAPEALHEIEEIYRRKFSDYGRAAETLQKYADTYPEREDAAEAYYDAAEMYREELNNQEKAIEILKVIIEKYPQSRYAERAQDDLAEIEGGEK